MQVSKTIELPEGGARFEGELSPEELDLVLRVGLTYLMQLGTIPITLDPSNTYEQ